MKSVETTVFDNDRAIFSLLCPGGDKDDHLRFSGKLQGIRTFSASEEEEEDGRGYGRWVALSVRHGKVRAFIGSLKSFLVEPGHPLVYFAYSMPDEGTITLTPGPGQGGLSDGSTPDIELYVFPGDTPVDSQPFLWLNAGRGTTIKNEITGSVEAWKDTRPKSFAPNNFVWPEILSDSFPKLVQSDPAFGGKPSINFAQAGGAYYEYPNAAPTLFSFLSSNSDTDWTMLAILYVQDSGNKNVLMRTIGYDGETDGSTRLFVDGGYVPRVEYGPDTLGTRLRSTEIVEKPSVFVCKYVASTSTMLFYTQGEWTSQIVGGMTPEGEAGPLRIGGGNTMSGNSDFRARLADYQLHPRGLSLDEISAYVANAVAEYNVDDSPEAVFPLVYGAGTVSFHRANRGLKPDGVTWSDTRTQASSQYDLVETEYVVHSADDNMGGHRTVRGNGEEEDEDDIGAWVDGEGPWTHLSGGLSDGFSIMLIFWASHDGYQSPLLSMSSYYNHETLSGTDIFFDSGSSALCYWNNDSSGETTFEIRNGSDVPVSAKPWCIILSVDRANSTFRTVEYDITNNVITNDNTGSFNEAPGNTAGPLRLLAWLSPEGYPLEPLKAGIADFYTQFDPLSDAEITEILAYARRRYTNPPASYETD